jgi:hypothetical protein
VSDPVAAAIEWAAQTDAPNGLVLLMALTSPWVWSRYATQAVDRAAKQTGFKSQDTSGDDPE